MNDNTFRNITVVSMGTLFLGSMVVGGIVGGIGGGPVGAAAGVAAGPLVMSAAIGALMVVGGVVYVVYKAGEWAYSRYNRGNQLAREVAAQEAEMPEMASPSEAKSDSVPTETESKSLERKEFNAERAALDTERALLASREQSLASRERAHKEALIKDGRSKINQVVALIQSLEETGLKWETITSIVKKTFPDADLESGLVFFEQELRDKETHALSVNNTMPILRGLGVEEAFSLPDQKASESKVEKETVQDSPFPIQYNAMPSFSDPSQKVGFLSSPGPARIVSERASARYLSFFLPETQRPVVVITDEVRKDYEASLDASIDETTWLKVD